MKLLIPLYILDVGVTIGVLFAWPTLNTWERIILTSCIVVGDVIAILVTYWELKGE